MSLAKLENLRKVYGKLVAVDNLNLEIQSGEILTLLGPNGAGKSTTIGMLLNLIRPSSGKIEILGGTPASKKVRRQIGATPQDTLFPENSKAKEVLKLIARHYENPHNLDDLSERFLIKKFLDQKVQNLSGGQRRCLALACAFVGNPRLIVLDEPTTGLDVDVRRNLWEQIRGYRECGGSILLTTHYLEEAEAVSDRVAVINRGRVVHLGHPHEIKKGFARNNISFQFDGDLEFQKPYIWKREGSKYEVIAADSDKFVKEVLTGVEFQDLVIRPMTLEEAFLEILRTK